MKAKKFIISGGGTGGHIFPAISIANELKRRFPDCELLFVGALARMEMEKVPAAGYKIIGLPIMGFDRKHLLRNIRVLWNLQKSIRQARKIIKDFRPDAAIGVGGYASAPVLKAASKFAIPTFLQEQNSFAGVTNKLLAKKAKAIFVAYDGMERFFPAPKIIKTGNPIRQDLFDLQAKSNEAYEYFGLNPNKKTLLIIGGSLGARTINKSIEAGLEKLSQRSDIQIIWQTGKLFTPPALSEIGVATQFISRMDYAYSVADLIISRAGASSISELCLLGKAAILVPSPNVAEDHQTHNAMALVNKQAAVLVTDAAAATQLVDSALETIDNDEKLKTLSQNIVKLAEKNSAARIVEEIIN
ncbi:MAG: undecaprenyldiphospho-muramoylpentapeptide beta-N-acetylglucosaminyltransferase, partial [Paludibacter sp.]|nr:undecaprenyldiphospho-muramoylpentapeptide beta-N-acetylglucosaminyltransferase [Paludibacter sp.]